MTRVYNYYYVRCQLRLGQFNFPPFFLFHQILSKTEINRIHSIKRVSPNNYCLFFFLHPCRRSVKTHKSTNTIRFPFRTYQKSCVGRRPSGLNFGNPSPRRITRIRSFALLYANFSDLCARRTCKNTRNAPPFIIMGSRAFNLSRTKPLG